MVVDKADEPAALLAQWMRTMRTAGLAGRRITQRELGEALGASGPLISSWESKTTPTPPPHRRLADYATFFATERSVAKKPFRLLSTEQLTEKEKAHRDTLLQELTKLWDEATGHKPVSSDGGHWHFPRNEDITIVCSALPQAYLDRMSYTDPEAPDYVELYKFADLDALLELHGHLRAINPLNKVRVLTPSEVEDDDYTSHLVMLGGVDWNTITAEMLRRLRVPVRQLARDDETVPGGFKVGEDKLFEPQLRAEGRREVLVEDVAHFFRAPSPLNEERTVTICNGMYQRGTYGVVRALTDPRFRERNEHYLRARFGGQHTFSVISRVKVVLGKTVTPDWTNSEDLLHEWPVPAA